MKRLSNGKYTNIHLHFQDESRLGLITLGGRKVTARGVKPVGMKQYKRQNFYLYGTISPLSGRSFFIEMPYLDLECFQIFMDEFAISHRKGLHLIVVDRASCHMSSRLKIASNIVLLPLPPYSPELNPIERFWLELKRNLKWRLFERLKRSYVAMFRLLFKEPNEKLISLSIYSRHF